MREEPAPRLVHGWYAGALLLESWYTSALLLESTQLLEICNPHSNETEMTHGSDHWPFTTNNCWSAATQSSAICTVHVPALTGCKMLASMLR